MTRVSATQLASLVVDAHIPTRDLPLATPSIAADNRTPPPHNLARGPVHQPSTLLGVQLLATGDLNFLAWPRLLL